MLAELTQAELSAETCTFVGAVTVRSPGAPVRFAPEMLKFTEAPAVPEFVAVRAVVPPGTVTLTVAAGATLATRKPIDALSVAGSTPPRVPALRVEDELDHDPPRRIRVVETTPSLHS